MAQEANRSQGPMLCTMGCGFYGNPRTNGMCSVCYKEHLQRQNAGGRLSPTATSPGNGSAVAVAQAAADSLASSAATATIAVAAGVSSPSSVAPATSGSASPFPAPSPSPSSTSSSAAVAAASSATTTGVAITAGSAMAIVARGKGSPATTPPPPPQQEPSQAEAPSPGAPGSPSSPITSQPSPVSSRMTAMTLVADAEDVVTTDQPVAAATAASADLSVCTLVELDGAEGSPDGTDKPRQQKKNRCHTCRKKVGLTGFECRCGNLFCGLHRYSDKHECSYDYKSEAAEKIRKENPIVVSEKIQKI